MPTPLILALISRSISRTGRALFTPRTVLSTLPTLPAFLLLASVTHPQAAQAQTILYSNLGTGNTYDTGNGYGESGPTNADGLGSIVYAFQFTATASGTVGSLNAALYNYGGTTSVTAQILNSAGTIPGASVLFSSVGTVGAYPGGIVTFTSLSGSPLTAGTAYWAAIVAPADGLDIWSFNNTGMKGLSAISHNSGATYQAIGSGTLTAFSLSTATTGAAATPEPESLALLALAGIPAACMIARRLRKSA